MVLLAVESGAVTFWKSDCSSKTYGGPGNPNGAVFAEGGDEPTQVTSTNGATFYATFVAPSQDPPVTRVEDAAITCP